MNRRELALAGGLLLLSGGCFSTRRAECDLFATTANVELEAIDREAANLPADPAAAADRLDESSRRYAALSQKVGRLGFATAELQAHALAYQATAGEAAAAVQRLAAALRARDPALQRAAEADLARVVAAQQQRVTEVNAFCGR